MKNGHYFMLGVFGWSFLLSIASHDMSANSEGPINMVNPPIRVTVVTDHSTLRVGQVLRLTYAITNVSVRPQRICLWTPSEIFQIGVFDNAGNQMEGLFTVTFQLMSPTAESFKILQPTELVMHEYVGRIVRKPMEDMATGRRYPRDYFLAFQTSAVHLRHGPGTYILKGRYRYENDQLEEAQRRFGFTDLWIGEVVSEPITITVK